VARSSAGAATPSTPITNRATDGTLGAVSDLAPVSSWWGVLNWWGGWLPAFVLTCVIELAVYLLMLELFGLVGRELGQLRPGRVALLVLGLNAVTHPAFWAVALRLHSTVGVLVGEVVVSLVEGALLWLVLRRRPVACLASAAVANIASAVLGSALLGAVIGVAS
jgi:hypothetical protein